MQTIALIVALLLAVAPCYAQTVRDCTASCLLITDPIDLRATACRLYDSGVMVQEVGPASGICQFNVIQADGVTKTYTARVTDGTEESTDSNTLTVESRFMAPLNDLRLI